MESAGRVFTLLHGCTWYLHDDFSTRAAVRATIQTSRGESVFGESHNAGAGFLSVCAAPILCAATPLLYS